MAKRNRKPTTIKTTIKAAEFIEFILRIFAGSSPLLSSRTLSRLQTAIDQGDTEETALLAFQLGVSGVLEKYHRKGFEAAGQAFLKRVSRQRDSRKAAAGEKARQARKLFAQTREQNPGDKLTKIYKDIAQQIGVKPRTVRAYLQGRTGNG